MVCRSRARGLGSGLGSLGRGLCRCAVARFYAGPIHPFLDGKHRHVELGGAVLVFYLNDLFAGNGNHGQQPLLGFWRGQVGLVQGVHCAEDGFRVVREDANASEGFRREHFQPEPGLVGLAAFVVQFVRLRGNCPAELDQCEPGRVREFDIADLQFVEQEHGRKRGRDVVFMTRPPLRPLEPVDGFPVAYPRVVLNAGEDFPA